MRIIITGGCGFVGFNLAVHLSEAGHEVTVLDNLVRKGSETNVPGLRTAGVDFIHGDIRNLEDLAELPTNADVLLECSAQPSVVSGYHNPVYDFRTNVEGVVNCLELCRKIGAGMIFLSSSRVYPANAVNSLARVEYETRWDWDTSEEPSLPGFHPVHGIASNFTMDGPTKTIYGASKAAADYFCQEYADAFGLPVVINRCGVVAGSGQFGVVNQGWFTFWAISCLFERPLTYLGYKGKQVRDILFIGDLCRLIDMELERLSSVSGNVWNVGGGRENSVSLVEATTLMEGIFGKRMQVSLSDEIRKGDMVIYITDNRGVSQDLSWKPEISLEEGADQIARWVLDNRAVLEQAGL